MSERKKSAALLAYEAEMARWSIIMVGENSFAAMRVSDIVDDNDRGAVPYMRENTQEDIEAAVRERALEAVLLSRGTWYGRVHRVEFSSHMNSWALTVSGSGGVGSAPAIGTSISMSRLESTTNN